MICIWLYFNLQRKIKEDVILPLNVKLSKLKEPDLNTTYDIRHTPLKQGRYENAFKEFIRRGKEMLFDQYYAYLQMDVLTNRDTLDYVMNVDASTEDKFEMVIKTIVSEKEIENYLHQCWRYNFVHKQTSSGYYNSNDSKDGSDSSVSIIITTSMHHKKQMHYLFLMVHASRLEIKRYTKPSRYLGMSRPKSSYLWPNCAIDWARP